MSKNALIWGADGGIGQAVARNLLEQGWQVVTVGRHIERMEALGGVVIEAEISDTFSVQTAVAAISQEVDEIDLWVYAIGDITSAPVSQMTLNNWRRILDANLNGAFLATHYSLPLLAQEAHLFYLGAISERMRLPGLSAYAAAKAGIEAFAEVVRKETRKRVSVVRPAAVDTPLWAKSPFKLPTHHLSPQDVAARILQAYQSGEKGNLDL
jgi:NAD(P)-dependent dehydrogenase (short-subunit alcohol dehydrogenase family)